MVQCQRRTIADSTHTFNRDPQSQIIVRRIACVGFVLMICGLDSFAHLGQVSQMRVCVNEQECIRMVRTQNILVISNSLICCVYQEQKIDFLTPPPPGLWRHHNPMVQCQRRTIADSTHTFNRDPQSQIIRFYFYYYFIIHLLLIISIFHLYIIHLLCMHNNKYCSETFFPRALIFSFVYTYTVD